MYKPSTKTVGRVLVTITAFALAIRAVNFETVAIAMRNIHWEWFLIAGSLNILGVLLSVCIWAEYTGSNDSGIGYRHLVVYYYITQFFSTFLPSTVGGDGARAYYVRQDHPEFTESTASIVAERLTGLVTLTLIAAVGVAFLPESAIPYPNAAITLTGVLLFLAGGIVFLHAETYRYLVNLTGGLPVIGEKLAGLLSDIGTYREHPVVLLRALAFSVVFRVVAVAVVFVIGQAVGVTLSFWYFLAVVPVIEFLVALPISINGWGVREAAFVGLFGLVGVQNSVALLLALGMYGNNLLFNSGLGGLVYALYRSGVLESAGGVSA